MSLLLSIETSTAACSVAVHEEGVQLKAIDNSVPQSASSQLALMIHQALEESGRKPNQLKGVIVAAGPGSYTGLRIGVATAKGICYALHIPLLSVNTLKLLAYQFLKSSVAQGKDFLLCPMIDARRMEVYCMLLNSTLAEVEPTQAKVIDEGSFSEWLAKKSIYFFGDGAMKCKEQIIHSNAHFISGVVPSASYLGELGFAKWKEKKFEDVAHFEPFYLKDFLIRKPIVA
jgi:tRNA threonylcarbamoyladenosine biosynthesis protein TsaB